MKSSSSAYTLETRGGQLVLPLGIVPAQPGGSKVQRQHCGGEDGFGFVAQGVFPLSGKGTEYKESCQKQAAIAQKVSQKDA
jgi:hypothetical protein